MNKTVAAILGFVAGAATGAGVTYVVLERKFQSEVTEVREVYREMAAEKEIEPETSEEITNEVAKPELSTLAKNYKASSEKEGEYTNYNKLLEEDDEPDVYIIAPEEFGEIEDYDTESLTWYSDHILVADSNGEVIKDVDEMFPFEFLTHFGDYEEDAIHVRNDELHIYYEVTAVDEPYKKPKKKTTKKSEPKVTMSSDE